MKGRYCIIDRIGKGGQGTLYLARDLELGIFRAVKELPLERKREAGLLRLLEYPSLPRMIDYVEQKERCFLVMEYIRGKSLRQCLDQGRVFSPEEIIYVGETVLKIFAYLHSERPAVFYGDLKPDNLMLTETGALYLVDFGSAVLGYERQMFTCCGTEGYAAPEQYQGQMSGASDLYALGRTLEELCRRKGCACFFQYPGLFFFIGKCCRRLPEKRWKNPEEALAFLKKIKPLSVKVRRGLVLGMGGLGAAALTAGILAGSRGRTPSFEEAVSPVVSRYSTMDFRSGAGGVRELVFLQTEESLQRLLTVYKEGDQQIRLFYILAGNSELQGNPAKAEVYYRQLIKEKTAGEEEYAAYGLFLIRQGRAGESLALYREYSSRNIGGKTSSSGNNMGVWRRQLKERKGEIQ